ncbi:MAG: toll/interleukin-1 receptor domain-containing protein [Lachnospiraceae bacterium]|nr:toll/interleukin-1 receptor domain-containing protein [Lachnospiraceae bacterium]
MKKSAEIERLNRKIKFVNSKKETNDINSIGRYCTCCGRVEYLGLMENRVSIKGFLSHAHKDKETADRIDDILRKNGLIQIYQSIVDNIWEFMNMVTKQKYLRINEVGDLDELDMRQVVEKIKEIEKRLRILGMLICN